MTGITTLLDKYGEQFYEVSHLRGVGEQEERIREIVTPVELEARWVWLLF
jgi:hypothetical protein